MTKASDVLRALSEARTEYVEISAPVSGLDFDNRKKVKIKTGKYEIVDDSDKDEILISDNKGDLYFISKSVL